MRFLFVSSTQERPQGNHYTSDDEAKEMVKPRIWKKSEEFFSDGMQKNCYTLREMCGDYDGI